VRAVPDRCDGYGNGGRNEEVKRSRAIPRSQDCYSHIEHWKEQKEGERLLCQQPQAGNDAKSKRA
jgi:hypothetical protein